MLIRDILVSAHETLTRAGIEDPAADAELIVGYVIGESRGRVQALALMNHQLAETDVTRIIALVDERSARVPLQHLTGTAPFRSIELQVGPGVFIPRPETEILTQFAIDELHVDPSPEPIAIDLCTGSGAIALAIASEVDRARVWAVEADESAHAWAARNVQRLGQGRVTLLHGDVRELCLTNGAPQLEEARSDSLLAEFAPLAGRVSVVATNPPYVPDDAIPIDPEVRDHDPGDALYSGADGLDLIRSMSAGVQWLLRPGGLIVIEHGEQQGSAVREILERDGWNAPATHRDLTFRDRVTVART